jgi:hypothetical protein
MNLVLTWNFYIRNIIKDLHTYLFLAQYMLILFVIHQEGGHATSFYANT